MKTMSVLIALTCALLAIQGDPFADPQTSDNVKLAPAVQADGIPDCEIGEQKTAHQHRTDDVDYSLVSGSPGRQDWMDDASQLRPFMDWGNDVLVDELNENPSWGKLATDVEADGTIWVSILDPDPGAVNDTIWRYYSDDAGGTWTYDGYIGGPSGDIRDFDMRVGTHGGTIYVYTFVVYDGVAGVYVQRYAAHGGSSGWTQIASGTTWSQVSADRNIETPQHLFCGYVDQAGNLKLVSSSDGGATFGNLRNVSSPVMRPSVAAGGDGYVYVCFGRIDSTFIWAGRYTNNLISPSVSFSKLDSSGDRRVWDVSVAAARTAPGGSQVAIAHYVHKNVNGNVPTHYAYTTNGGTSWAGQAIWPPINQARATWDARYPFVRQSYYDPVNLFRGIVTMHEPTASWDTIVYSYSRIESPTTWEARAEPNDHRITGEFGAALDWSGDINGSYIIYREYASTNIWVDGWNYAGVEEGGKPVAGDLRTATFLARDGSVSLNMPAAARVRAVLFDGAGRRVRELFSGTLDAGQHRLPTGELARGIHFLELDINGSASTVKLVNVN